MTTPYPSQLIPTGQERISLPSGKTVDIPKATPTFKKWEGEPIKNTFNGKPLVETNGKPVFAELAILHLFLDSGWSGRWVETYGAKKAFPYYFSSWADKSLKDQISDPLPEDKDWGVLEKIMQVHGTHSGFWDVMAWKEATYIFAEAKHSGKDSFSKTQKAWVESALKAGLDPSMFLVVEWRYDA